MSYFNFDLQLFSGGPNPVTVDLSTVKEALKAEDTKKAYVNNAWENYTEETAPAGATATLVNGNLTIYAAADAEVTISGVSQTDLQGVTVATKASADGDPTSTTVKFTDTSLSSVAVKGKTFVVTSGGVQITIDASVTVTKGDDTFVIAETAQAQGNITVSKDGVISAMGAGAEFTVSDGTTDKLPTTYTIGADSDGKSTIQVSGDYAGLYNAVTLAGTTITPKADAMDTITLGDEEETLASAGYAADKGTITLDSSTITAKTSKYYALTVANGQLEIGDAADDAPESGNYFVVTYDPKGGLNATITVQFVGTGDATAQLLEGVTINAASADKIGSAAVTSITVADGLATGKVTVSNVPTKANVTVAGTEYTKDETAASNKAAAITYVKTFAVASSTGAANIDLSKASEADTYYFLIDTDGTNQTHGKMLCTVNNTTVVKADTLADPNAGKAAFKVEVDDDGKYAVSFQAGDGTKGPQVLTDASWANITVTAPSAGTVEITPDNGANAQDKYTVNAAVGVVVTPNQNNKIDVVRTGKATTSISYSDGSDETPDDKAITLPASGPEYWKVTRDPEGDAKDGNPKISITKVEKSALTASDSYIVVNNEGGNVTVTYSNGGKIALNGLKKYEGNTSTPVQVAIDGSNMAVGKTLDITDADGDAVDYNVKALPNGVTVEGAGTGDTVARAGAEVFSNDVKLTLTNLEAGKTYNYLVSKAANADTKTGLTSVTAATTSTAEPTGNYFTVVVSDDGKTYTVSYTKAATDGIDLNAANTQGKTTINADGITSGKTIVLNTKAGNTQVVNGYAVTNVVHGGLGANGIMVDGTALTSDISYKEPYEYKLASDAAELGAAGKYAVSKEFNAGVWTYKIVANENATGSYFNVALSEDKKTATIEFKPGSGQDDVTYKEFAQNISDKVTVAGDKLAGSVTTLVLTKDSTTDGSIEYNVTNLPKTVETVTNVVDGNDSISYAKTYQFAKDGNKIALNGEADAIYYYEVASEGGDNAAKGVYTCTIGKGTKIASDKLSTIATKNYFKVVTDANGKPIITYHVAEPAEGDTKTTVLTLTNAGADKLEVAIDPTNAGKVEITCGAATGDDGSFKYVVNGLSKDQSVADGDGAGANSVEGKYNISYAFDGMISLTKQGAGTTEYYSVVRSGGTDSQKGIVTFTLTKCEADTTNNKTAEEVAKAKPAYFMVKYSSEYQVNITYVNPTGVEYDLTATGVPQVVVDADGLATGTKIDTINVADTTGGDYNKVNYALTNVPAGVKVVDTNNENNALGEGDTVSYKNIAVLAANSTIKLGTAAETYYVVTAGTTNNGVTTCTVAADGTKDKPADTANYFVATKSSDGKKYEITYHMANGTGYAFTDPAKNSLNINAAGVTVAPDTTTTTGTSAPGAVSIDVNDGALASITKTVTNAAGGVTVADDTVGNNTTISYSTTFAWKPGTYYIPVVGDEAKTVAAGAVSGATVAGDAEKTYVEVTVETSTDEDGNVTYKATPSTNVFTAGTKGAMGAGTATSPALTLTLDKDIAIFNATSTTAYKAINGVTADDTLTNVAATTVITTASLKSGEEVSINDKSFKSGSTESAGAAITFTGATVTDGVILLDKVYDTDADAIEGSVAGQTVTMLGKADGTKAGVTVTFAEGKITAITGLDDGDQITVGSGATAVTYGYFKDNGKSYIAKAASGNVQYAAVPSDTSKADLLTMAFSKDTTQAVGTLDTDADKVSYLDMGTVASKDFTVANQKAGTALTDHYYVKIETGTGVGTISAISVVKGNKDGLVDSTADYTGTITVPAGLFNSGVVTYTGTPDTKYKVAFTDVKTGSRFSKLDADDTIQTGALVATENIIVNGKKYTADVAQADGFTFKGNALTKGSVKLVASETSTQNGVLEAADGTLIAYTAGTDSNGAVVVFGAEGITSITGLTNGESVTLTSAADADGTVTVTTYTANGTKGETVTRTIATTTKDGETTSTTDTLTIPLVDDAQSNILAVKTATGLQLNSQFTWATDATPKIGYFELSNNTASIAKQDSVESLDLNANTIVIKAESKLVDNKVQLTIKPLVYGEDGQLTDTKLYGNTINVNATGATKPISFNQSTVYKVAFTNVAAGSEITNNQEGSTIETAQMGVDDKIVVNGQTVTNKVANGQPSLYIANSTDVRVVNGTILVDGTMKGEDTSSSTAKLAETVTYIAGEADDSKDGVEVAFVNGVASTIKKLDEGEQVVVKNGNVTTTYKAANTIDNKTVIWRTVTGSANADDNVTKVISITPGENVVIAESTTPNYVALNPLKSEAGFSTKYDSENQATATGFFLVQEDGSVTIADVKKDTTIATYENVGATLIQASIDADGKLTLKQTKVNIDGSAAGTPADLVGSENLTATIKVTDAQKIVFTKPAGVKAVAITGVGKESEIKDVVTGTDTVTTATLAENDTVTVGSTKFTAGAAGTLTFDGTAVKTGTFKVGANSVNELIATNTNDSTKVTTENKITYTAGTADGTAKDGVNVVIVNGMVQGITGLGLGETVSYTQTVTAKDGSKTEKFITYQAANKAVGSGAQEGAITVTKTVSENGNAKIYTQTFSSDSLDITKETGWAVKSASTTSLFDFGTTEDGKTATGYFAVEINPTEDKTDANYGKYKTTDATPVAVQNDIVTLAGSSDSSSSGYPKYYLKVTATKGTAGNVTFTEMGLVALKANGVIEPVTDKELYQVSVTAPAKADIKLADHDFTVAIKATDSNSTFSNVGTNDTVTVDTLAKDNYVVVNSKKYTSAYDVSGKLEIKGDTIVSGKVKVEGTALTANADGAKIEYTAGDNAKDGVIVEFTEKGGIASIKDLDAGEKVTVTAKNGTVTTYERTGGDSGSATITKKVKVGEQETVWTYEKTNLVAADTDIMLQSYGVSTKFSWPADGKTAVAYAKVDTATATIPANGTTVPIGTNDQVVRMEVARDGSTFTVKSLKVLKGTTLTDATGKERNPVNDPTAFTPEITVNIQVPAVEGATIAFDNAVSLPAATTEGNVVDRNVKLNITGAKNGQVYTGLAADDTVATTSLKAGEGITVKDTKFAVAEAGAITVKGDGTAYNGGFKLASGYVVKGLKNDGSETKVEVSMDNGDAMVTVVEGKVQSIYELNAGETVTVTETDKNNVVSTVTYTGEAVEGKTTINITRTTFKDGVKTIEKATNITDGADVLGGSAVYTVVGTDSGVTSQFNWTLKGGSGYFQLTDKEGKLLADTLSVADQSKSQVKIGSTDAGKIYAKVSLSADNTLSGISLSGISLYKVKADGTLEAVTALSGDQKVNVVIKAPEGKKLTADLVANKANITANTIQIVGAADESVITLRKGDSLTTASLTASSKPISVDDTSYQAGGNTILKFVKDVDTTGAKAVLTDGIVKLTHGQGFTAAGAKVAEAGDNIAVAFADVTDDGVADSAVVTVVNGVVTNISGTGKVTVGDDVYTYNAETKVYDVDVTTVADETFTTAKLAKGAVITIGGATYKSGAADNSVTFKNEGGTNKLYSGVVTIPAQGTSLTITDGDAATADDVTVTYKTAANGGAPTVKVVNGTIQSITGLNAGETLTVVDNSVDKIEKTTTYTATATGVTREVKTVNSTGTEPVTTTVTDNATLLAGGDLLTASYYNGTDGGSATQLVGQFSWNGIAGRSISYFDVTTDRHDNIKATVLEQDKEKIVNTPSNGEKTYLVASAQYDEDTKVSTLTLGNLLTIASDGTVTTTELNKSTLTADSVITINAPAGMVHFEKPATNVKIALKNLAADSEVSGLIKGDTVATATLAAGDSVKVGNNTYTAAVKGGVLNFIGEGAVTTAAESTTVTAGTGDNLSGAALLSGTVKLAANGGSAKLAGGAANTELGASDDITVTNNSATDKVVVKVTKGVVASITGLTSGTVTVTNASGKIGSGSNAIEYSGATIVYRALGDNMYSRTIFKDGTNTGNVADTYDDGDTLINAGFLTTSKSGGEIYTGNYKQAIYTPLSNLNFSNTGAKKTTTAYYKLAAENTPADDKTMVTSTTAAGLNDTVDGDTFLAEPGKKYMVVTATTTADGVTTIKSVDGYEAGATGKLTKNAKLISSYTGTLTIDGKQGMSKGENATYDEKYAVINYTLTKNGTFDVVAEDVSYKSKFTNLGEGDKITTAAIKETALSSGTYYIYHGEDATDDKKAYTETRTIKVKSGRDDSVKVSTDDNGKITQLTGLATKKEQVTVTELTAEGLTTTVYAVTAEGVVTRTITAANGTKSVATTKATVKEETDFATLADEAWTSTTSNTIAANFDWTLQNNTTGYFLVGNNAATATTKKNISIKSGNASSYIAVKVSDNGVVESVEQVSYDSKTGTMQPTTEAAFSGKLTMVAPTAYEFNFNRTDAMKDNVSEATLIIKDIIAGSAVTGLVNNDTVTTKKLKKETSVSVNGENYTVSSSGGALGFKVQDVSINGEDYAGKVTLTSGTVSMGYSDDDYNVAGQGFVYVGSSNLIEAKEGSYITVTANANGTFSIGDLDENESFTVNGYTYMKSGTNLVRTYNDAAGAAVTEIYNNFKGAKTVSSKALNNDNNWKYTAETLTADETGAMSSSYGIVTANLALADNRFAADKKAAKVTTGTYPKTYDYVLDKYVSSKTNPSDTKALNGYVVSSAEEGWQTAIGHVTMEQIFNDITNTTTTTYIYRASSAVGQAINVAANWLVEGSDNTDKITGATKGTDFIRAGKGDDNITLRGASDIVAFNLAADGQNTVSGYTTSKDAIVLDTVDSTDDNVVVGTDSNDYDGNFSVYLDTTNKAGGGNVYLYADNDGKDGFTADDSYVMLQGVGKTGKAVTINDKHFYFGNGYTSKKGATFAYEDGAYYVGNTSKLNGLQVTTDKTKATKNTLGDDVTIDLMAVDGEGHSYYTNINTIDASKSANRVVLSGSTESGANITLKGGTYQSTLKSGASNDTMQGGKGQDMFWFDDLSGSDTISSYTSGRANKDNDAIYVNGSTDLTNDGYTVKASGNDVIISSGDNQVKLTGAAKWSATKAITVSKDGKINGDSVSYFVGKSGNKVSNTFTYVDGAYYVGNKDTNDATGKVLDTLKVTGTVKTKPVAKTTINLDVDANKYQSIEAVDASTLKAAKTLKDTSTMGVVVTANNDKGTLFKASNYSDTFICDADDGKGTNVLQGFSVGDIIQINGLDETKTKAVAAQINSLTKGAGDVKVTDNMTLTFKGTKGTATVVTENNVSKIVMK